VFAEQLVSPELMLHTKKLQERQRKIVRSMSVAGICAAAVVVASFYSGLIYLLAVGNMPLVPGVILLILLTIAVIAGSLAIYSEKLRKTLSTSGRPDLPLDDSASLIEAQQGSFVSVTERTTNLLGTKTSNSSNIREVSDQK